ncbi:hypothetical protein QNH10_01510 [Sporosarcina thermotolerans]|uniref:hypothetical protein n=1 Tax=Sporosarcina thermotolerans TaxID=633404 RepID=UPI0024BC8A76|nr:hypothetical protein [Sporosarcina thermotolerans]WHT48542.1 hypothetical protein QNH10_01510 [Sporosarcina thermotolerans]
MRPSGKLLFIQRDITQGNNVLHSRSSGSSNDSSSWYSFQAIEPLSIEKILFPFNEPIEERFNFTINDSQKDKSLESLKLPIHIDKDKYLTLRTNLKTNSFVNPYAFSIRIDGTTEQGKPFTSYAHYHMFPYLTQEDVNRVIDKKARRDSVE